MDIFARNAEGQTAYHLCENSLSKTKRRLEIIKEVEQLYDESAKRTDELMDELMAEEERQLKISQKKKEKKQRSKLQKLAEKNGCTVEQLEHLFAEREN